MSSRSEDIIKSILEGAEYTENPQSRMEGLLIQLGELIKSGGATSGDIQAAVNSYLESHPEAIAGVDKTELLKKLNGGT